MDISLRKYQLAMQQYQGALDLIFQRTAELEIANARITELEKEKENGEQRFESKDGASEPANVNDKP